MFLQRCQENSIGKGEVFSNKEQRTIEYLYGEKINIDFFILSHALKLTQVGAPTQM